MTDCKLTINGKDYTLKVEEKWTLLYVLREVLGLTGTKEGCGTSDCGACKVLVDGKAVNSCSLLALKMEGKKITTIEGIGSSDKPHPIQEAFIEAGAVQCGFCTPGMIISTKALLDGNIDPSEEEIREGLSKNLCRCTGYVKIIDAVNIAAAKIKELK
ncbi:MAG: carbon-monoxide dehydrogenase small subunit [Fusobacteria bacterium]|nr:MAG: carbon-monoxide dehydrogenase small subunit [Fusobacteriota bacterium]KAF0230084.1 MAG: carbon-monoxide dehydrogenase small [Fusobacteriota bacterium]